jgi:hypothetical protein
LDELQDISRDQSINISLYLARGNQVH